jgi:phage shock protein A
LKVDSREIEIQPYKTLHAFNLLALRRIQSIMASLLDKVSTLISANLHYMIDQALQNNSPAVIDQYIRQVESNLADLEDAAAAVGGEVKGIQRRLNEQEQKVEEMDRAIDAFLVEGNESAAVAVQSRYNSSQRLVEAYREQLTRQDEEFKNLLSAKVKLEARLATMKAEREELTALLELAKSKETTVKAIKSLKDLTGSGDADIARIANSIRTRLDKASTASEMQTASLDQQMDDVLEKSALDTQLAERKKKLGLPS